MPLATAFEKQARIGGDAEALLRAAQRQPEARPHLVEDQQRAARRAEALELGRKPGFGASNVTGSRITQAVSSSRPASTEAEIVVRRTSGVSAATPARDARGCDR